MRLNEFGKFFSAQAFYYNSLPGNTSAVPTAYAPEAFGAVGDEIADDTAAMLAWVTQKGDSPFYGELTPGKRYAVSASLVFSSVFNLINFNGAIIVPKFGSNYGLPLFTNDRASYGGKPKSCNIVISNPRVIGSCTFVNLGFNENSPPAGLTLAVNDMDLNSNNGNRPEGSTVFKLRQVDFVNVTRGSAWNFDLPLDIGDASNYRECTQLTFENLSLNQCNGGSKIRGVSKADFRGIDFLKTNTGVSLEGRVELVTFLRCHVEGLGQTGGTPSTNYNTKSSRIHANSENVGFSIVDDSSAKGILFDRCDTLDIGIPSGGSAGTALASAYIGGEDRTNPNGRSVKFKDCNFSTTMCGAPLTGTNPTPYKAIVHKGRYEWEGAWKFTDTTAPVNPPNGVSYIDFNIKDKANAGFRYRSLLGGNTVLSLIDGQTATGGSPTPPVITENTLAANFHPSDVHHSVVFKQANYKLVKTISLPYGWITLDVSGYKTAGNPMLLVQMAGGTFTEFIKLQFNGLNDKSRRWRVFFWNPTPQVSCWVGLTCQQVDDACEISHIDCYPGLPREDTTILDTQIVAALPAASARWESMKFVIRNTGVADTHHLCVRDAANAFVMKQIALT